MESESVINWHQEEIISNETFDRDTKPKHDLKLHGDKSTVRLFFANRIMSSGALGAVGRTEAGKRKLKVSTGEGEREIA